MDIYRLRGSLTRRMTPPTPSRPALLSILILLAGLALAPTARAQVSFASAVDRALSNSPRVRMALADLDKAHASLSETHSAYIPAVNGSIDLGKSVGPPLGEPSLFTIRANSLVFSDSQEDYIRSAKAGIAAATSSLEDARDEVAEDAAIAYLSLDSAQQRRAALVQQFGYANRLAAIIQQRLDAGQDTPLELLQAKHTAAQIRLQVLQLDDEIDGYRAHLTRIDGLSSGLFAIDPSSIPPLPEIAPLTLDLTPIPPIEPAETLPDTPAVTAAFDSARAKRQQAFGDSRYVYRPQVAFFAEYSRFTTFDNNYRVYYPAFNGLTLNATAFGIEITVPFLDRTHVAKARESLAEAHHAEQQALYARDQMVEGRAKLQQTTAELSAQAEVADLDQKIAQQQLDAILVQQQSGNGNPNSPPPTPKDEQNARIQERQRYLDVLDAKSKLRETQIQFLRLTGQLDTWLKSAPATPAKSTP